MLKDALDAFREAHLERCLQAAALTTLAYEFLVTFDLEVEFFWKKRWSIGKVMFLWSRYYSLAYNTGNVYAFMQKAPTLDLCAHFFHWQNAGATLQVITTHIILELRLYAMYESSRKILVLFVCMLLGEIGVIAYVVNAVIPGEVGTNEPVPSVLICADGDPEHVHFISYYYTAILIVEVILLSLALFKAFTSMRYGAGGNIIKVLTRDSVKYFACIFIVYVCNQVIWLRNDITLNESMTGFGFVISAIMANRLMINVRHGYYTAEPTILSKSRPTIMRAPSSYNPQGSKRQTDSALGLDSEVNVVFSERYDRDNEYSHAAIGCTDDFELKTFNDGRLAGF